MANELKQILSELRTIRIDVEFVKEHMVDIDAILTREEEAVLNKGLEEFIQRKTVSLEDFEKEMAKDV